MTREQLDAIRARYAHPVVVLLAEVERLTVERDAAFQRGVAAMREAAAQHFDCPAPFDFVAARIRALPDPEDKS